MATEAQLETDLAAAKSSLDDAITRGVAAITAAMANAGPVTQAQLDAADAAVQAMKAETDAAFQAAAAAAKA